MELDILGMGSRLGLDNFEQIAIVLVLVTAFVSLIYAAWLRKGVLKKIKVPRKCRKFGTRSALARMRTFPNSCAPSCLSLRSWQWRFS